MRRMTPFVPDEAKITLDQLRSLKRWTKAGDRGDIVNITVRDDVDSINPDVKGKTIRGLEWLGWFPSDANGIEFSVERAGMWYHDPDMRCCMVHCRLPADRVDQIRDAHPGLPRDDKPVLFGFHGWLIEKIQKVVVTEDEILEMTEAWHKSQPLCRWKSSEADPAEDKDTLHDYLGWTWEQYKLNVEQGVIPYAGE